MTNELVRLITEYKWLRQVEGHSGVLTGYSREESVSDALNRVFMNIVRFPADDPRVSYCQIAFLLELMADESFSDSTSRFLLRDAVLGHVKRITDRLHAAPAPVTAESSC